MDLPSSRVDNTAASTPAFIDGLGKNSENKGREDLSPKCPDLNDVKKKIKNQQYVYFVGGSGGADRFVPLKQSL